MNDDPFGSDFGSSMFDDEEDDDEFFDSATANMERGFQGVVAAQILALGVVAASGLAAAYLAWAHAPAVGGAWWPYIRVVVAILAAAVGVKVGAIVAYIVIALGLLGLVRRVGR